MPVNQKSRPLREIFGLAHDIGSENVLVNYSEVANIESGDDSQAINMRTIANRRYKGEYPFPWISVGREPRARLSDVLAYRDKLFRKAD